MRESVGKQLRDSNVQIAIDVMHRNFDVAKDVSAESITSTLQKRISELAADVFQESIKLESQGNGGLMVSASINRRPIRMVIDTGASVIALPSTAIATLELNVPADAPTRDVRLANGQRIQARSVQLPTVRVGAFQAEDVTAIILGPEAANTPPLLGMSFLKRFKFELDAAKKELRLLRVQ
ncbi:MAG: retropepsin-like aspartic protease [Planctomycetota bacterium]